MKELFLKEDYLHFVELGEAHANTEKEKTQPPVTTKKSRCSFYIFGILALASLPSLFITTRYLVNNFPQTNEFKALDSNWNRLMTDWTIETNPENGQYYFGDGSPCSETHASPPSHGIYDDLALFCASTENRHTYCGAIKEDICEFRGWRAPEYTEDPYSDAIVGQHNQTSNNALALGGLLLSACTLFSSAGMLGRHTKNSGSENSEETRNLSIQNW